MSKHIGILCSYVIGSFKRSSYLFTSSRRLTLIALFLSVNSFGAFSGLLTQPAYADSNTALESTTVSFQGRLNAASGVPADASTYNIEFKLYNSPSGGIALWSEDYKNALSQGVTVDNNGYFTVNLGSINPFTSNINWAQKLWLTMNVGGDGQTPQWDGEMNPRMQLTAVPYAFQAGQLATQTSSGTSILSWTTQTQSNNLLLPNESGTLCVSGDSKQCGFVAIGSNDYIQNATAPQPNTNFNITGSGTIGGDLNLAGQDSSIVGSGNVNLYANGSVIAKSAVADSAVPAFAVQNASATNLLSAYTSTNLVKIGMGQPTLASSGLGDLYVTGNGEFGLSLRVGDATNGLSYKAGSAPSATNGLYNGTSRPIKTVSQTPAFSGLVVSTNPKGSLTTNFDSSSTGFKNYYNWSTSESTAQTVNMYIQIPVPRDFSSLTPTPQICFNVYTDDSSGNSKISSIFYDTKNSAQSGADITPSKANIWQKVCTNNIGGTITSDGSSYVTEMISLTAAPNTNIRLSSFGFDYLSAF